MPTKWERIDDTSERLKVFGGWLVRSRLFITYGDSNCNKYKSDSVAITQTFINDIFHEWEL